MGIEVYDGSGDDPFTRKAPKGPAKAKNRATDQGGAPMAPPMGLPTPANQPMPLPMQAQQHPQIHPDNPEVKAATKFDRCGWLRVNGDWPNQEVCGQKLCTLDEMKAFKKTFGFRTADEVLKRKTPNLLLEDQNGNSYLIMRPLLTSLSYNEMRGFNNHVDVQFGAKGDEIYLVG